jgi:hypothetical protein
LGFKGSSWAAKKGACAGGTIRHLGFWTPKFKRATMALRWEVSNFLRRIGLRLENAVSMRWPFKLNRVPRIGFYGC